MSNAHLLKMRRRRKLLLAWLLCAGALLACTSNDTLFIHLTATPIPTATPTPSAAQSRFRPGRQATFVGSGAPAALLSAPDPSARSATAACFTATLITIEEVRIVGAEPFYRVTCASQQGWVAERNLTTYKAGDTFTASQDMFLTNDPGPDDPQAPNRASSQPCRAGQTLSILDFAFYAPEGRIYLNVQCGAAVGWVPEPQP